MPPGNRPVVAIDGPAGAGKSTVARALADRLGFTLLDTGALYRGVALAAQEAGVSWEQADALGKLATQLELAFEPQAHGPPRLLVNRVDRSLDIRTPEISRGASAVSKHPAVRVALLGLQRRLGAQGGIVAEGRDIGTVVFPEAEIKAFLTADTSTRARRRLGDLQRQGVSADLAQTLAEIEQRDRQDSTRPVAPLRPAHDAVVVDTGGRSVEEVVQELAGLVSAWSRNSEIETRSD